MSDSEVTVTVEQPETGTDSRDVVVVESGNDGGNDLAYQVGQLTERVNTLAGIVETLAARTDSAITTAEIATDIAVNAAESAEEAREETAEEVTPEPEPEPEPEPTHTEPEPETEPKRGHPWHRPLF